MITLDYNGYGLQTDSITTTSSDLFSTATNAVQLDKIAHADGGRIVQQFYDSRTFTINGVIKGTGTADMQSKVDEFKAALSVPNGVLTYQIDTGSPRIIYCTAQQITITDDNAYSTAPFSVQFVSADGMKWDKTTTTLVSAPFTASNVQPAITIGGSYKAQPDITVTFTAITGGTNATVSITNGTTLQGVSVTRTWSAGDFLEVDCLNMLLYVNSVPVDFTGQFPTWQVGAGSIRYIDTFTTRTATLTATYTKRYA